jgi:hypothetical protein
MTVADRIPDPNTLTLLPLCDLRDLCAMLSPLRLVLAQTP